LLDAALEHKLISQSGSWYSFDEERLGQGRENVLELMRTRSDQSEAIRARLLGR
jgi:recombination protein RecA